MMKQAPMVISEVATNPITSPAFICMNILFVKSNMPLSSLSNDEAYWTYIVEEPTVSKFISTPQKSGPTSKNVDIGQLHAPVS